MSGRNRNRHTFAIEELLEVYSRPLRTTEMDPGTEAKGNGEASGSEQDGSIEKAKRSATTVDCEL
jgi:hypothetical protein